MVLLGVHVLRCAAAAALTQSRDLHTVDDGILSVLPQELSRADWDVLVVHFLGVDHVGHTYGPATRAMADKLTQVSSFYLTECST